MASNRYRNRAGDLKPRAIHRVTVVRNRRADRYDLELRPLESIRAAKIRFAKELGARMHDVTIGPVVYRFPRSPRVLSILKAAIAAAKAGRFSAEAPDLDHEEMADEGRLDFAIASNELFIPGDDR